MAIVPATLDRPVWLVDSNAIGLLSLRASLEIPPDEISQLAFERARRVQGYLLRDSTIVPERVYIVGSKNTYPPDSLGVRVGMTLTE